MRLVAFFVFACVECAAAAVGFRSQYQWDATRQYDAPYAAGSPHSHVKKARPIFIAMWYPAQESQGARMKYRDYLASFSDDPAFVDFSKRLMRFTRVVVHEDAFGQGPEDSAFERFLDTSTTAVRDANPPAGRFPVVIYHPGLGGSFEDNSLLFEQLAAHGFVVIGSAYQNADASTFNINGDLVTSLRDMEFLLRFAATVPFADTQRIGVMGHSYGAQAAMDWLAEPNSPVDAVVSLDSTVENVGLDTFVALKERIKRMADSDVPVMQFASRKHHPKFSTYDEYLKCNPRFQVTVDYLEHNDYITHGTARASVDTRRSYDRVCALVLKFFDAFLNNNAQAAQALRQGADTVGQEFVVAYKAPLPLTPTGKQLAVLMEAKGSDQTGKLLETVFASGEGNLETFAEAGRILLLDGRNKEAMELAQAYVEVSPKTPFGYRFLAEVHTANHAYGKAVAAYKKALGLLDKGSWAADFKERYRFQLQTELDALLKRPT